MLKNVPNINFLAEHRAKILIGAKRSFIIQMASFAVLILFGLGVVGMLSFNGILSLRKKSINKKIDRIEQSVEKLGEVEEKYYRLKLKTEATVKIVDSMNKHQKILEAIFYILPEGVSVKGVVVNEEGDIKFDASTEDPEKLDAFIEILEKNITNELASVNNAAISQVSVNEEGMYTFNTIIRMEVE